MEKLEKSEETMEKSEFQRILHQIMKDTNSDYKNICKSLILLTALSFTINIVLVIILLYGKGYFTIL